MARRSSRARTSCCTRRSSPRRPRGRSSRVTWSFRSGRCARTPSSSSVRSRVTIATPSLSPSSRWPGRSRSDTSGSSSRSGRRRAPFPCPGSRSTGSASRTSLTRSRSATASCCSSSAPRSIPTTRPSSASCSWERDTPESKRWPSYTTWHMRRSAPTPRSARCHSAGCSSTRRRRSSPRSLASSASTRRAGSSVEASRFMSEPRSSRTTAARPCSRTGCGFRRVRSCGRRASARATCSRSSASRSTRAAASSSTRRCASKDPTPSGHSETALP